jgi:hypothetical protein
MTKWDKRDVPPNGVLNEKE